MKRRWKNKRVGLALGSGGARGWAHIGAIEVLQERGIEVDVITGTSMGAVVGAYLAAGQLPVLRELADNIDWRSLRQFFWEVSLSRSGLTDGNRLLEETGKMLGVTRFEDLQIPFAAVATRLDDGGEAALSTGNLLVALRASISIPGLFSPVQVGDHWMVDGGLVNPVPVNVARAMGADMVIAVDISQGVEAATPAVLPVRHGGDDGEQRPAHRLPLEHDEEETSGPLQLMENFFEVVEKRAQRLKESWREKIGGPALMDVMLQSVRIMEASIARTRRLLEPPDVTIQPEVGDIGTLDFQRAPDAIRAGRRAAKRALDAAGK